MYIPSDKTSSRIPFVFLAILQYDCRIAREDSVMAESQQTILNEMSARTNFPIAITKAQTRAQIDG
jgi:hypothetical protein